MIRAAISPKIKPTKCKVCGEKFPKQRMGQKVCGQKCAAELARIEREKRAKAEYKERKEALKTRADYAREAQAEFNRFIRHRDAGQGCISCGTHNGKMNAGHYLSVGAHPHLRFVEDNCHLQCERCNTYLSGNIAAYRPRLLAKIGADRLEALEGHHEAVKVSIDDLKAIKATYKAKCKALEAAC